MVNRVLQSGPTRSELVRQLLAEGRRRFQQNPQSVAEAGLRTGAGLIDVMMQKKLMDEELERRTAQRRADMAALQTYATGFDPNALASPQTSELTKISTPPGVDDQGQRIDRRRLAPDGSVVDAPPAWGAGGDQVDIYDLGQPQPVRYGDPMSQEALSAAFMQNPDMSPETATSLLNAGLDAQYRSRMMGSTPANVRSFEHFMGILNDPNATEEQRQAAEIALDLAPGAGRYQVKMIGDVPHMFNPTTGRMEPVQVDGQDVTAESVAESAGTVAEGQASGAERGKGTTGRLNERVTLGLDAARGLPVLRRAVSLLESVETGGLARAQLAALQYFGIEGADEGELSANLGRAVLSQLKQTFGNQFTEKEGERLEGYSAGFGRSAAANRRILRQTLALVNGAIERGLGAAHTLGDEASIQELMDFQDGKYDLTDEALARVFNPQPTGDFDVSTLTVDAVSEMDQEERSRVINSLTDEQISALSDEIVELLSRR
jgi:hypothetical protein